MPAVISKAFRPGKPTLTSSPASLEELDVAGGVDGVPQLGVLPLGEVVLAVGRRGRRRGRRRRGPLQLED